MTNLGTNLAAVRGHNGALVIDLIRREPGISRVELAKRTGLVPTAISKIVNRLVDGGVVMESGRVSLGVGKPRTRLRVVPRSRLALGMHLDRDGWRMVRLNLIGDIESASEEAFGTTPSPQEAVEMLGVGADRMLAELGETRDRVVGAGLGMAGPLDHERGVVTMPTNFEGWKNIPLAALVSRRIGLPVTVDNDMNATAIAECWRTPRSGTTAVVYVGTGLSVGLVLAGQVYRGSHSAAGEFGHMILDPAGPACSCGSRGCLEAMASPAAIVSRYSDVAAPRHGYHLLSGAWAARTGRGLVMVRSRSDEGDQRASSCLAEAGTLMGIAIGNLVALLDIDDVILSGPLLRVLGPVYHNAVRDGLAQWQSGTRRVVPVATSDLDVDAVALGAGLLALGQVDS